MPRKCNYPNCKKEAIYNVEGETKALYCSVHKLEGMNNICLHKINEKNESI